MANYLYAESVNLITLPTLDQHLAALQGIFSTLTALDLILRDIIIHLKTSRFTDTMALLHVSDTVDLRSRTFELAGYPIGTARRNHPGAPRVEFFSSSSSPAPARPWQPEVRDGEHLVVARLQLMNKLRRARPPLQWESRVGSLERRISSDGTLTSPQPASVSDGGSPDANSRQWTGRLPPQQQAIPAESRGETRPAKPRNWRKGSKWRGAAKMLWKRAMKIRILAKLASETLGTGEQQAEDRDVRRVLRGITMRRGTNDG